MRGKDLPILSLLIAFAFILAGAASSAQPSGPRADEPVVLRGAGLPALAGQTADKLVAFRWAGAWEQIPVQVDQRKKVDLAVARNDAPCGLEVTAFADARTLVGPDPDPGFDADDEIVFLAGEAGESAPQDASRPSGTLPGPGKAAEIVLTDPDTAGKSYVYLFVSDGSLDPAAEGEGVSYQYHLLAGNYPGAYDFDEGPNPEDSDILTPYYRLHFSDRWVRDELAVTAGASTGVNILDHQKFVFYPGNCGRTEVTFSEGGGGFFANLSGPVRGIRSYVGANSGYATQRDHFFYPRRHEIVTYCRVHPIPGALDFMDYGPGALGMGYANEKNTGGCLIDGAQDQLSPAMPLWEMVTGPQGTLSIVHGAQIDVGGGFELVHYYDDDATPEYVQCTGDSHEYGASGPWIVGLIWNTDPLYGPAGTLTLTQAEYFDPPLQGVAVAEARAHVETHPLQTQVRSWPSAPAPEVTSVTAASNPFRLKVGGSGFQQGCTVRIGGATVPTTAFKSDTLVVAKSGSALKAMVPKGVAVNVKVANPDGTASAAFAFTR